MSNLQLMKTSDRAYTSHQFFTCQCTKHFRSNWVGSLNRRSNHKIKLSSKASRDFDCVSWKKVAWILGKALRTLEGLTGSKKHSGKIKYTSVIPTWLKLMTGPDSESPGSARGPRGLTSQVDSERCFLGTVRVYNPVTVTSKISYHWHTLMMNANGQHSLTRFMYMMPPQLFHWPHFHFKLPHLLLKIETLNFS